MNGDLIDVAFGRPWRSRDAAADETALPRGTLSLQVDLGFRCPIRRVEIGTACAARPSLALSDDGQVWRTPDLDASQSGAEAAP